jgi:Uma2 family endonuclease
MSIEAIANHMPAVLTLDDLAVLNDVDQSGHRYELSPEGVLSIMPPPGLQHALTATRMMAWLLAAGWTAEQMAQAVGLRIPGRDGGEGGRIPDLIVWSTPPAPNTPVWLSSAGIALVVEIISPSTKAIDKGPKRNEYAAAGVPRYWTVDRDPAQTVTMYELAGDSYESNVVMPLEWVLNSKPTDHLA